MHALSLKIGILGDNPPYSLQVSKNNLFSGFEAQLMATICERLQATCTYISMPFENFFPQLNAGKIDLAIGQISITLDREKEFLFSEPYMVSNGQFIVKSDSSIQDIDDFKYKKIGVYEGSLYRNYLLNKFNNHVQVIEYTTSAGAFEALVNNEVDGLLLDNIAEKYWIANSAFETKKFHTVGASIPLGNGYGIMANLQSLSLINNINQALSTIEADGTYIKLYNLYFTN